MLPYILPMVAVWLDCLQTLLWEVLEALYIRVDTQPWHLDLGHFAYLGQILVQERREDIVLFIVEKLDGQILKLNSFGQIFTDQGIPVLKFQISSFAKF